MVMKYITRKIASYQLWGLWRKLFSSISSLFNSVVQSTLLSVSSNSIETEADLWNHQGLLKNTQKHTCIKRIYFSVTKSHIYEDTVQVLFYVLTKSTFETWWNHNIKVMYFYNGRADWICSQPWMVLFLICNNLGKCWDQMCYLPNYGTETIKSIYNTVVFLPHCWQPKRRERSSPNSFALHYAMMCLCIIRNNGFVNHSSPQNMKRSVTVGLRKWSPNDSVWCS